MYESSGSQFFRTTTEIQSGPDALEESRSFMTFLTIFGIKDRLSSFKLVSEENQVKRFKEIQELSRLEFHKKNLANNFVLLDAKNKIINLKTTCEITFLR